MSIQLEQVYTDSGGRIINVFSKKLLQQNFTQATVAVLLWHVQRFWFSDSNELIHHKTDFSLNSDCEWQIVSEMGHKV